MSWHVMRRVAALAICGLTLAGCITATYGPIGAENSYGYGYSDLRNADGSYTIRVVATTAPQAHEFWDRRAAELCGSPNFRKNIFRAEIPVVTVSGYAAGPNGYGGSYVEDRYGSLILEGYLHCEADAQTAAAEQTPTEPTQAPEAAPSGAPPTQP